MNLIKTRRKQVRTSKPVALSLLALTAAVALPHAAFAAGAGSARISVVAMDARAAEAGSDNATFFITREGGATNQPLAVSFALSGSASKGADYADPGVVANFFPNAPFAVVTIKPKTDTIAEGEERVVLALIEKPGVYTLADRKSAEISIFDNAAPAADASARAGRSTPPSETTRRTPRADRTGELFVSIEFDGTGHWENRENGAYSDLTYRRSLSYTVPMSGVYGPGSGFTDIERRDRKGGIMIPNLRRYLILRPRDQWIGGADRVCGHGTAKIDDVAQGLAVGDPGMPPLVPFKDTVRGGGPFPSGDRTVPERDLCEAAVSIDYDKHVLHLRIDGSDSSIKVQHDYNGHRPAPNNLPLQGYDSTGKVKQQLMFIDVPIPDGNRFEGSRVIEKFNNVDGPNHTLFPLRATVKWRVTLDP